MKNYSRTIVLASVVMLQMALTASAGELRGTQESRVTALSQFYQANSAYKEGDYPKAIENYEGVIKGGMVSGPIYYNLGNSYFKAGDLGAAILNYEKAKRFIPRDSDLEANARYAVSLTKNLAEALPVNFFEKIYSLYGEFLTIDEITLVLFWLFVIWGAISLGGLYGRWPPRTIAYTLVIFLALFFFNLSIVSDKLEKQGSLAVVMKDASAKFEPRDGATTHFELAQGWKVISLDSEGGWAKVKRQDGKVGWVKKELLGKI